MILNITFKEAVVFLPLITAIITFVLTSLFTMYKERKINNISKRVFIDYAEYELRYPFDNDAKNLHGEGTLLLGKNGKKLYQHANQHGGATYTFLVIKNITTNDVIDVKVKFAFSDRLSKNSTPKEMITEEFFMPVWKSTDSIYIPATIYNHSSHLSTNEELVVSYSTTSFERFKYSYKRQKDGTFKERLKKRYFGFIWITKIRYKKGEFHSFIKVKKNTEEAK